MHRRFQVIYNTQSFKNQEAIVEGVSKENAHDNFFKTFNHELVTVVSISEQVNYRTPAETFRRVGNPPEYMS